MEDNNTFNYLSQENNARALYLLGDSSLRDVTSNLLSDDDRRPWLSSSSQVFPHTLYLDLSNLQTRPDSYFRVLAFKCWHAYTSNPQIIRLSVSNDGSLYLPWQSFEMELRAGTQVFKLKEKIHSSDIKWMRLEIIKSYDQGGNISGGGGIQQKTYINQVMLYDEQWLEQERNQAKKAREANMISEYSSSQVNIGKIISQGTQNSMKMIYSDEYIRPDSFQTLDTHPMPEKSTLQTLDPSPFSLNNQSIIQQKQPIGQRIINLQQTLRHLKLEASQQSHFLSSLPPYINPQIVDTLNQGYQIVNQKIQTLQAQLKSLKEKQYSETSQFVQPPQPLSKEDLVKECMQQCKIFIEQELQKVTQSHSNSQQSSHRYYPLQQQQQTGEFRPQTFGLHKKQQSISHLDEVDKENMHPNISPSSLMSRALQPSSASKLEKTLERSINNFIEAQSIQQEGDYSRDLEEAHMPPATVNQSYLSSSDHNNVNSSMVSRMAQQLQMQLENKAQRLQQLLLREQQSGRSPSEEESSSQYQSSFISESNQKHPMSTSKEAIDDYLVQNQ